MSIAVLALFSAVASAQTLALGGDCPGVAAFELDGITPGGEVMLLVGSGPGALSISGGPCRDADSGLSGPLRHFGPFRDPDLDGSLTLRPTLPGGVCGRTFAFLDLSTCEASNTATFGGALGNLLFVGQGGAGAGHGAVDPHWFHVDLDTGAVIDVGPVPRSLTGLSLGPAGRLWGIQAEGREFPDILTIDPATGAQTVEAESADAGSMSGFAWRDGELLAWTESGDELGILDPVTGAYTRTGITNSTGGHCMATDAAGRMIRLDRNEVFETAPDGTDIALGVVSGMGSYAGHGCTFHDGMLYSHDNTGQLFTIDTASWVASPTGIVLPEFTDALGSLTP
ncbi:MAG: hypothetical protein ACI8PZ_005116 [Myxococcota bacterium]|jgi:hypothetical protein